MARVWLRLGLSEGETELRGRQVDGCGNRTREHILEKMFLHQTGNSDLLLRLLPLASQLVSVTKSALLGEGRVGKQILFMAFSFGLRYCNR